MEHTRIDEGTKRGKKNTYPQRENSNPRNEKGQYLPLLPQSDEQMRLALEAYQSGLTCTEIAQQFRVSTQAVYGWLLADMGGSQHDQVVTKSLTARIANADQWLEVAPNPLELSRAREMCRNARQDYERRRPGLYGQKQEVTLTLVGDLGDRLRRAQEREALKHERTIEGTVVSAQPALVDNSKTGDSE